MSIVKKANKQDCILNIIILIALILFVVQCNSCQKAKYERRLKDRAFEIMEQEPDISMEDALDQATYELDLMDDVEYSDY